MSINRLFQWIKEVWYWLAEGKIIIMCLLVITATFLLGCVTWQTETSIRIAGYVLQLVGMIFAVRWVLSIRAHFGQPTLREMLYKWTYRYPKWKHNSVVGVASFTIPSPIFKGKASVWAPDNPAEPIEERINCIVKNLERIRQEQNLNYESIDALKASHENHKKLVTERTTKLEKDIYSDLELLHTSDLLTSLVGLTWLTFGITMSTLAPELYNWLYPA